MSIEQNIDTAKKTADFVDKLLNMIDMKNIFPSLKARQVFISEIEKNDELSTAQKMALLYHFNDVSKRMKNFYSVLELTEIMLNAKGVSLETAKIDTDSEWFSMFSDIAKNVSDEEMQHIWAKILASKCEDKKSVDKKLLSILQIMEPEDAEIFSRICANSVFIIDGEDITPEFIYPSDNNINAIFPEVEGIDMNGVYESEYLNCKTFTQMQSLGLIKYHTGLSGFYLNVDNNKSIIIDYYGKRVQICSQSPKMVCLGIVELTRCGKQLVKILYEGQKENKNLKLMDKIIEYYQKQNLKVN